MRTADVDKKKGGRVDGGDDGDKDVASKWEDDMLEKAAEAYIQGMIDMGKISGGDGKASILPPAAEDEKKESKDDENKEEEWDSIGDGSSSSSSSSGFFRNQQPAQHLPPSDGAAAETNSLEEIFAEESDPDDFEYESHHDPAAELAAAVQYIEESFDPHHLSQRNAQMNWDGARDRLASLLDELAYNRMLHLSKLRWESVGASATLVELTRALLDADIANDPGSSSSRPAVIKTETLLRRPTHLPPLHRFRL